MNGGLNLRVTFGARSPYIEMPEPPGQSTRHISSARPTWKLSPTKGSSWPLLGPTPNDIWLHRVECSRELSKNTAMVHVGVRRPPNQAPCATTCLAYNVLWGSKTRVSG